MQERNTMEYQTQKYAPGTSIFVANDVLDVSLSLSSFFVPVKSGIVRKNKPLAELIPK